MKVLILIAAVICLFASFSVYNHFDLSMLEKRNVKNRIGTDYYHAQFPTKTQVKSGLKALQSFKTANSYTRRYLSKLIVIGHNLENLTEQQIVDKLGTNYSYRDSTEMEYTLFRAIGESEVLLCIKLSSGKVVGSHLFVDH